MKRDQQGCERGTLGFFLDLFPSCGGLLVSAKESEDGVTSEVGNGEVDKGRTCCQGRVRPVKEDDGWQRSERTAKEEPVVKGGRGQQRRMTAGKGGKGWQWRGNSGQR